MHPVRDLDLIWKVLSKMFIKFYGFPLVYPVPEILGLFMR